LDVGTTKDALTQLLSEAGSVVEVYLPADRETGRPRGFAFVQFTSDVEAAEAIRLFHDREVDGRKLTVNIAGDRPPRRDGPRPFDPTRTGGGDRPARQGKPFKRKGSRRGLRGRKRSL
jgi:RNA recognition motif-containing protein